MDDNHHNGGVDGDGATDVFDISAKEHNPEALLRWRKATLVLNATRRFRYTTKVQASEMTPAQKFRKTGHAVMAAKRFESAGKQRQVRLKEDMGDGFGLTAEQLVDMNADASADQLKGIGGVLQLCKALRVNPEAGISTKEDELEKRKTAFGTNTYPPAPYKSWFLFAWEASKDKTLIILMICAVISLIAGITTDALTNANPWQGWYDGVAISVAVIAVVATTATSDYVQSLKFRGLDAEKANIQLTVLRDGRMQTASIFTLLVGDVVPLSIGDQVPADGVVLTSHSLVVDESTMTGESDPVHKGVEKPYMMSGCKVVDGVGKMVVTAVGTNTEWGKVAATLNAEEEVETPLQVRLNGLATGIGKLGLVVAALVFVALIIRFAVEAAQGVFAGQPVSSIVKEVIQLITIAITIIVVAVPEGLPLAVTLSLAFSMTKMMKDKALVRRLSACETMGCATTICSDKTGTLTLNQMTVTQEFWGGELQACDGATAPGGRIWELLSEGITQNGTGSVYLNETGAPEITASPTEKAIIGWAVKLGLDFNARKTLTQIVGMETFSSTKKRGGVAVKDASGLRFHWKGAAEIVVGVCSRWMGRDGEINGLDATLRQQVEEAIASMAAASLRCVALAYREASAEEGQELETKGGDSFKVPEEDLVLLGILGIKDPCRPGVPDAVARCQKAGVKVRMVTGDNVLTARAIAGECGILTPNGVVIEGKDFRVLSQEQMIALLPKIDVMARSSPTDKHILVKTLRYMGEVVAVTGDGTNDAPALKEADIGLSMGISGTEVAKESSDIVILDDNFTSIVKVVRWGRSVFANLQKFIQFQLTVNIAALAIDFIVACVSGSHVPLTAVQLLWINLIMDTLAAVALATEPPTDELLEQKPVGRRAPLITNVMWRNLLIQSAYQVIVLLVLYWGGKSILSLSYLPESEATLVNNTIIFNAFVFCQLFNEFNCRKPEKFNVFPGLHRNPLFIVVVLASAGLQVLMVEVLHDFADTTSLTWAQWLFCIIVGLISIPLAVLGKFIPVPKRPFLEIVLPRKWRQKKGLSGGQQQPVHEEEGLVPEEGRLSNREGGLSNREGGHLNREENGDLEAMERGKK